MVQSMSGRWDLHGPRCTQSRNPWPKQLAKQVGKTCWLLSLSLSYLCNKYMKRERERERERELSSPAKQAHIFNLLTLPHRWHLIRTSVMWESWKGSGTCHSLAHHCVILSFGHCQFPGEKTFDSLIV
jgi:hypothetical protein